MTSLDERKLLERLKEVQDNAEQAALLSDLGNLHLSEGRVQEGEECFRRALAVQCTESANGDLLDPQAASVDEDDWETGEWEQNLGQITPYSEGQLANGSAAERRQTKPWERPAAQRSEGTASRKTAQRASSNRQEDVEVPFDGRHILELYGLTSADTATHLETFLATLSNGPIDPAVRWVNDSTVLAVFSNPSAAQAALQASSSPYSMRPFSEACDESKRMPVVELQPPRPRPKTSAAVAKRLIGMALGAPNVRDKAAEQVLRQQRDNERELKRERQKQVDATWDD